jgi:cytochrome c oxidase subunit 2
MRIPRLPSLLNYLLRVACVLPVPILLGGWGMDGKMSTMEVDGPVARTQLDLFMVTFWVTGFIFVCVAAVLAYATIKFRARSSADEHAEPPPQGHGNPVIEIGLIVVSVLMLVIIAVPTLKAIWSTYDVPESNKENAIVIKATGYQWWFKFEYSGYRANLPGGAEMPLITANEFVIPVDTPIRIDLRTVDVIHSLWLPKLAGKVDMIPNRGNHLWLQADKPGYYWGQCAEFCGESHSMMRFRAIVLEKEEFAKWAAHQAELARTVDAATATAAAPAPETPKVQFASYNRSALTAHTGDMIDVWKNMQQAPDSENPSLVAEGREAFKNKGCISCHMVRGHEGVGSEGPDLTRVGARSTIAAGLLDNTPENLKQWVLHPNDIKPGNGMFYGRNMPGYMSRPDPQVNEWVPNIEVTDTDADALVAYLRSLR